MAVDCAGGALRLLGGARQERGMGLVPDEPAAGLRMEMRGRAPAAGDAEQIATKHQGVTVPSVAVDRQDFGADDIGSSACRHHGMPQSAFDPRPLRKLRQAPGAALTRIDDGNHLDAGALQVERRRIGRIVVGGDHRTSARCDAVLIDIGARRGGQHDVRSVIVGKDEWPLDRAGRQHDLPRADLPEGLAADVRRRLVEMVAAAFDRDDLVMVVIGEGRGAGDELNFRHRPQLGEGRGEPCFVRNLAQGSGFAQERAAERSHLVEEKNAGAASAGGQRRGKTRRPAADDEDVAMRVALLVMIGIGIGRRLPHSGGAADQMLVEAPGTLRRHEGLVIETGRQQWRHQRGGGAEVEAERGKPILAGRHEPVIELDHGGARIRLGASAVAQANQRIGLFGSGAQNAARAVVFEAAPDQADAVGEQRRRQAVAG